jgi:hypothetical protein
MSGLQMTGVPGRLWGMLETDTLFLVGKTFSSIETIGKIKNLLGVEQTPLQSSVTSAAGTGKLVIGIAGFPGTFSKIGAAGQQFFDKPSLYNAKEAVVKVLSLGGPANDLYDFVFKNVTTNIPKLATTVVKGLGPVGMGVVFGDQGVKNVRDITQEIKSGVSAFRTKYNTKSGTRANKEATNALTYATVKGVKAGLDSGTAAAYVIFAVVLFVSFWFGVVFHPAAFVLLPAFALVTMIGSKFWDKIFVQSIPPQRVQLIK